MTCIISIIYTIYNIIPYKCNIYDILYRVDKTCFMKSITTGWRPPKAAANPLSWMRAPKAPAPCILQLFNPMYITRIYPMYITRIYPM